jgi:hypothetical protein
MYTIEEMWIGDLALGVAWWLERWLRAMDRAGKAASGSFRTGTSSPKPRGAFVAAWGRDVPPYVAFCRVVDTWFFELLIGDGGRRGGMREYSGMFAAWTRRTATMTVALSVKINVRGLISLELEQKRAFFAAFLTLNHFDFS